jgi:hypothetical protein
MMFIKQVTYFFIAAAFLSIGCAHGQHDADHHAMPSNQAVQMSPELKQFMVEKMQNFQNGMTSLFPAIVSGNWQLVTEIGQKIHDSNIMYQNVPHILIAELHHSLPAMFQELDHSVHHSAGMLAQAAKMKDAQLVNFYYYKITETCVSCHSRFASDHFPGLSKGGMHDEHHQKRHKEHMQPGQ